MGLESSNIIINLAEFAYFWPHSPFPGFHIFSVHHIKLLQVLAKCDVASVNYFFSHLIVVHLIHIRCLLEKVHLHSHRLIHQFLKFCLFHCVVIHIYFKLLPISSRIGDPRLLKPDTVRVSKLVDLMSVKFGNHLEHQLLFDREIILNVVVKHLKIF